MLCLQHLLICSSSTQYLLLQPTKQICNFHLVFMACIPLCVYCVAVKQHYCIFHSTINISPPTNDLGGGEKKIFGLTHLVVLHAFSLGHEKFLSPPKLVWCVFMVAQFVFGWMKNTIQKMLNYIQNFTLCNLLTL